MTRLPEPEQWVIEQLDEHQVGDLIEEYVEYVDKDGNPVRLQEPFVRHFMKRDDGALPTLAAIATAPIVLADGVLMAPDGLHRDSGIAFIIPNELREIIPAAEECDDEAVAEAMRFLVEEWLCDVATDYVGKVIIVAGALTLIERSLLPDRPAFFVTAGKRGNGKTTTLRMLIMAVTGLAASAAAWSSSEEERRKAIFSYFLYGVPYILWDNIPRGTQVSCPHVFSKSVRLRICRIV
jgi:hypothetical protein